MSAQSSYRREAPGAGAGMARGRDLDDLRPGADRRRVAGAVGSDRANGQRRSPGACLARLPLGPLVPALGSAPRRCPGEVPATRRSSRSAAEQYRVQLLWDVIGRDRQVLGVVAPRGVIEVDRTGLPVVVQDVLQAQGRRGPARNPPGPGQGGRARLRPVRPSRPLSVTQVSGVARGVPIAAFVIMTGVRS